MPTRSQQMRGKAEFKPPKTKLEQVQEAKPNSFLGKIMMVITEACRSLLQEVPHDAKTNKGGVLAELFMWHWIEAYAAAKYKQVKKDAREQGILNLPDDEDEALIPGSHIIGESRHFVATASVTEPVKRFSGEELAQWFWRNHQIPVIVTKEQIEKAKKPTKSTVKVTIVERT